MHNVSLTETTLSLDRSFPPPQDKLSQTETPWTETSSWTDPPPLWTEWHTSVKNITLPQASFAGGKNGDI